MLVAGRLVDLGPPRQRALFGLLLSRVDRPVTVDSVIEHLWAGDPPGAAMASMRAYVANLRRVLEPDRPPRAPATVLRTRAPGYLLSSRGVDFDVHRFIGHVEVGQVALGRADPAQAVREFDVALGLWHGPAYADVADVGWAVPEIARLEELRLSVVEARCEAQLQLGARHGAVAELEMHVRAHPLREHGCALLALALYRAGRQAEALGVLRVTRARLAEELGIDPGTALQRLERDILTQAPALDWQPPKPTPSGPITEIAAPALPDLIDAITVAIAELDVDELGSGGPQRVVPTHVQGLTEVVGRQRELAALRAAFTDPARQGRPIWRVLTGLGGVGKTSLARAYAQCYHEHYGLVWWVRAENPEAVPGEFRALLDILAPQYAEQTHEPVQAAHAVLANYTEPWLLIIDDIDEPETLRGLFPAAGIGDVLVTSRAGTWPDRRMVLPVAPLAQTHAVALVTSLSGDNDQATAAVLVDELGGLPLALAQAGCYVVLGALDLAGYLALYRDRRAELHRQGHAPDYPATVATTWQLAFDQLTAPARALLNLLAWYAPDTIPLDQLLRDTSHADLTEPASTLLRPLLADKLEQHRAITELIAYGLLTRAGPRGSVTMHRLIQAVTADQLTAAGEHRPWIDAAAALLIAAYPLWPAPKVTITAWRSAQTHVRAVLEHLDPDQPTSQNLRTMLIGWTGSTGDFGRARELAAAVVDDMTRMLGPDDRHTLLAQRNLAYWVGQTGDIQQAREAAAVVVKDMTRVLGPDHPETLFARGGVVRWTALSGDVGQARELIAAVVEDTQRVLGPDHRHTLTARANLARWTGEAGDVALAAELAAELVADDERILGPDHRHTLLARANLARWTGQAGDAALARELATAVHEDFVRVYGADHRYTLRTLRWLAPWNTTDLI
ncbi:MAG: FxSxx-COOH system tetratricopeptide repeat protein [Actinomycetes bacterium]